MCDCLSNREREPAVMYPVTEHLSIISTSYAAIVYRGGEVGERLVTAG